MALIRRIGRFSLVFAVVLSTVALVAEIALGTGYIVGQHTIALDIVMPKDKAVFKAGENVHVTVKSSGFTGVKIVAKDTATGREEEVKAALVKSEGSGSIAPKMWNAPWSTSGKKPGTYTFTVTGLGGGKPTPVAKTVTISIVQPSGTAKMTFKEPAANRRVKPGETVNIAVMATGVHRVEFFIKDLRTGSEKMRPSAHASGSDEYRSSWSAEGQKQGDYQIIALGLGADGTKLGEGSVTVSVVEPAATAQIKITSPSEGAQFKKGSSIPVIVQAQGITKKRLLGRHPQTGTTFFISAFPSQEVPVAYWNTERLRQGTYQILAEGFDSEGKKNAEASVTITITGQ